MSGLIGVILFALAIAVCVLVLIFVIVPVIKGVVWLISNLFKGIGWVIQHIFSFIFGMIGDTIRAVGSVLAMIVLAPMVPLNVIIGRWSAAGHFAESIKRECKVLILCVYRVALQRPLRLVLLHGLLEGLEDRVPEAMAGAPTSDKPSRRTGTFEGYTIVGSLRGGGSGGKLYIAQPSGAGRTARLNLPDRVVIKSFALTDGSSLPQIIRESRALEAARKLGLVLDHSMDEHRFWYVMPYHTGDNLGVVTRQLHAESSDRGLTGKQLPKAMGYLRDLLETVSTYHRGGLWHKDIKPENIIINENGARLVDLGLVTPLRSAMTLTTHGTEYFRDPEMVRLALRGVKVHQVDGAKFDIFAIGAVLYFVLENTFPAHGGLSRFSRRSPEALRWIVRRAMADYNKRYETADILLADLNIVLAARDPFTVRPVDLPSMGGAAAQYTQDAAEFDDDAAAVEDVVGACSPQPKNESSTDDPWPKAYVFAAGLGSKGPFAKAGKVDLDDDLNPVEKPTAPLPKLRVTNWWTGRYAVDFASSAEPAVVGVASPKQAFEHARKTVRSSTQQARRAARLQVREARSRAQKMRKKAASRRTGAIAERQPSPWVILTTLVVLGLFALLVVGLVRSTGGSKASVARASTVPVPVDPGPPVIVIDAVQYDRHDGLRQAADNVIQEYRDKGFDVVVRDDVAQPIISEMYAQWKADPNGPSDDAIEDALELYNYYGILHISQDSNRRGNFGIEGSYVYSTRDGAAERRRPVPELHPILLINDHPDADEELIDLWIDNRLHEKRLDGYEFVASDVLAEATLHPYLELWKQDGANAVEDDLARELLDLGYSGVLYMTEGQSFGTAGMRVNELFYLPDRNAVSPSVSIHASSDDAHVWQSTSSKPLLLVNDHPGKTDPSIESAIQILVNRYKENGFEIVIDDDVEVLVRRLLPIGAMEELEELSAAVESELQAHGLGGIVRIVSRPGGARIDVERLIVDAEHVNDETAQTVKSD